MIIIFKVLYLSHTSPALKHCIGPLLSSEAFTGVFFNCLPPHFQKRHEKFAQPTRSLSTLKSNFWPISPLKLQCKTSKWRQEPIHGSITLKIVLWALSNISSYLVERAWGKKVFFGLTYYTGLTQKHCLNYVTPSYKKCPASPSGQFPTLPLSFPHSALWLFRQIVKTEPM